MPGGRSRGPLLDPTKSQARVEIVKPHENRRSHSLLLGDLKQRDAHGADRRHDQPSEAASTSLEMYTRSFRSMKSASILYSLCMFLSFL